MAGTLYLCATPIGNLEDITFRVLRTLKEADLIAAEDTRHSIKLLNHFEIKTPMTSYHEYNKVEKAAYLVSQMAQGLNVALITDAGTPSEKGDKKERARILEELKRETRTIIVYEAPHHLVKTLKDLYQALGNRRITVCRELTKKHETAFRTTFEQALSAYEAEEPRGECVIVIEGISVRELEEEKIRSWEEMSLEDHLEYYMKGGMDKKEAMKAVAKDRGVSRREIYQQTLK